MLDQLPLELAVHALRVSAEVLLHLDRTTVCNIARSSAIGYNAVIPILYRTLIVGQKYRAVRRVFRKSPAAAAGATVVRHSLLAGPPSQRLCPHVRRVFFNTFAFSEVVYLPALVNLQAIISLPSGNNFLLQDMFSALPSSLRHFHVLTMVYPAILPNTVTHVSYYIHLSSASSFEEFDVYMKTVFGDAVTHVALELNQPVATDCKVQFTALLRSLLMREPASRIQAPVVLRLYNAAVSVDSQAMISAAIAALGSADLCNRVVIWNDHRHVEGTAGDVRTSLEDAIFGRTPWTESNSLDGT